MSEWVEDRMRRALAWWDRRGVDVPTSARLGTGAIADLERWFARSVGHRGACAVGSGRMALFAALSACRVGPASIVVASEGDKPSTFYMLRLLGVSPMVVRSDWQGFATQAALNSASSGNTPVVCVITHRHDIDIDLEQLRSRLPYGSTLIGDVTQVLDSAADLSSVGASADFMCASLSHDSAIDAGEGGLVSCGSSDQLAPLIAASQHPMRQYVAQLPAINNEILVGRIHACAAILALYTIAGGVGDSSMPSSSPSSDSSIAAAHA